MMPLDEQNDYYLLYLIQVVIICHKKSTISHNHRVAILNNTLNCGLMLIIILDQSSPPSNVKCKN